MEAENENHKDFKRCGIDINVWFDNDCDTVRVPARAVIDKYTYSS